MVAALLSIALVVGQGNAAPALRVRRLAWGASAGLLGYIYFLLGLPGTEVFPQGGWMAFTVTFVAGLLGVALSQITLGTGQSSRQV